MVVEVCELLASGQMCRLLVFR